MCAQQVVLGQRDELSVFGDDYDTPDGTCIRDYMCAPRITTPHKPMSHVHQLFGINAPELVLCAHGQAQHLTKDFADV